MNKINTIPNILVSYLERSPTAQVTLSSTDMNSLKLQTMMFSNPYTCVELELKDAQGNNCDLKIPIKLFLSVVDAEDFIAQEVNLVKVGALASKAMATRAEVARVCILQYFSKSEKRLKNLEIVMPDTLKQIDDVIEKHASLILSEEQVEYFEKLIAAVGSKSFLSACDDSYSVKQVKQVKPQNSSQQVLKVDFANIGKMMVEVPLASITEEMVVKHEVAATLNLDNTSGAILVSSELYCVLVCSIQGQLNARLVLGIPHTNMNKLPREQEMWMNVELIQHLSEGQQMCRAIFRNRVSFSSSLAANFLSLSSIIGGKKSFLITETALSKIQQECLQRTGMPFILCDQIPQHLQILSSYTNQSLPLPQHPSMPVSAGNITNNVLVPQLQTQSLRMADPAPPRVGGLSPKPTRPPALPTTAQPGTTTATLPTSCPSCPEIFTLNQSSDVASFAKHFYTHFSISSHLIPEFLKRFSLMLGHSRGIVSSCPFFYCSEVPERDGSAVKIEKHLRRKHQFEILCFQISTISADFEQSSLFLQLMKNCKIEHAKLFIKSNLKKFRATSLVQIETEKQPPTPAEKLYLGPLPSNMSVKEIVVMKGGLEVDPEISVMKENSKVDSTTKEILVESSDQSIEVKTIDVQENTKRKDHDGKSSSEDTADVEIVGKGLDINKHQATENMKQFFRANVKDEDCSHFLKSRGVEMPIGMVDKLLFFLFDVSSSYHEALQMIKFAVKNLKRIVQKDGSLLASNYIFESEYLLQLKMIQKYIFQFKDYCRLLFMNPKNCNTNILVSIIAKLVEDENMQVPIFLSWLGKYHQKKEGKPVSQLEAIVDLTPNTKLDSQLCNQGVVQTVFEKNVYKCEKCDEKFVNEIEILLHTGNHEGTPVDVFCTKCEENVESICIRDRKDTMVFTSVLALHLTSRNHLHNSLNSDKLPVTQSMCDVCDAKVSSQPDVVKHVVTRDHVANNRILQEYLEFCIALQLDPVNHSEFPHFIFFLRCIHSLSINLQVPIRQSMDVVSNIHANFNSLLNVNESSDVKDEVVRKLSSGEPAIFFCYSCSQSFLTFSDIEEHLAEDHDSADLKDVPAVRCIVCKTFVLQKDLKNHDHSITDSGERLDCNVEVIDVEGRKTEQLGGASLKDAAKPKDLVKFVDISKAFIPAADSVTKVNDPSRPLIAKIPIDIQSEPADVVQSSSNDKTDQIQNLTEINEAEQTETIENLEDTDIRIDTVIEVDDQSNSWRKVEDPVEYHVEETMNNREVGLEDHLFSEESVSTEKYSTQKLIDTETIPIAHQNMEFDATSNCDQDTQDRSITENTMVDHESSELPLENERGPVSEDVEGMDIHGENESNDVFADDSMSDATLRELDTLNDNVVSSFKEDDEMYHTDQNNSNIIPSWEFVPIKGQNFQFHVFPPVDSIPEDPVEKIHFDITLQDILEMHKQEGGFYKRNNWWGSVNCNSTEGVNEKRKANDNLDVNLGQYKKLRMDLRVRLTPCKVPGDAYLMPIEMEPLLEEEMTGSSETIDKPCMVMENTIDVGKVSSIEDAIEASDSSRVAVGNENTLLVNNEEIKEGNNSINDVAVKRGRGRPRKTSIDLRGSNVTEDNSQITSSSTPDGEILRNEQLTKIVTARVEMLNTVGAAVLEALEDSTSQENQGANKVLHPVGFEGEGMVLKKITFKSGRTEATNRNNLESEFEFDFVEPNQTPSTSVNNGEDSTSDYEDSDEELEIIDEIPVDEVAEKMPNAKNVKLEPKDHVENSSEKSSIRQNVDSINNSILEENPEIVGAKIGNINLSKGEPVDHKYRLIDFKVKIKDIALDREWKEKVGPQVEYYKTRAAVITRWENDIQAYFKQRS